MPMYLCSIVFFVLSSVFLFTVYSCILINQLVVTCIVNSHSQLHIHYFNNNIVFLVFLGTQLCTHRSTQTHTQTECSIIRTSHKHTCTRVVYQYGTQLVVINVFFSSLCIFIHSTHNSGKSYRPYALNVFVFLFESIAKTNFKNSNSM